MTYRPLIGDTINRSVRDAIRTARKQREPVTFWFNDVLIVVAGNSDEALILRDYNRVFDRMAGRFTVGPHPRARLSAVDVIIDAFWRFVMVLRRWRVRYGRRPFDLLREACLRIALAFAPPLRVRDADAWRAFAAANTEPMGARCVRYATEWARLMQARIDRGQPVASCEQWACDLAVGRDNPSGYVVRQARRALISHWIHGEDL